MNRTFPALGIALGAAACSVAGPAVTGTFVLPRSEPEVSVGVVVGSDGVTVASEGRFDLVSAGGNVLARVEAAETWRFTAGREGITATGPSGRRVTDQVPPLTVRPSGDAGVIIDGVPYRGGAVIRDAGDGRVTVVNTVALEEYLLGVVPLELGERPESEIEAVKAQAVAARTYAVRNRGGRSATGFDFYATVADQVYGGRAAEEDVVRQAVEATRGEVVVYQGEPILAYYHSTCGGRTANVEEVWAGRDAIPYLRSVSDAKPGGGDYCDISNRYHWSESWTRDALLETLRLGLAAHAGPRAGRLTEVRQLEIRDRTASGRVAVLGVVTDRGRYEVRGDSTRRVLRPEPDRILNSSRFELDGRTQEGQVVALTLEGGGWGHGVGMCQMGAVGRAREGQDYRDILRHYYRGTDIIRLY